LSARRPRHGNSDYEALLKQAEDDGWRVTKGKKHFRALCAYSCGCRVTVAATPATFGDAQESPRRLQPMRRKVTW